MSEKTVKGWYSIELEKATKLYNMTEIELRARMQEDLDFKVPLRLSIFDFLCRNNSAFGPFISKKHALAMTKTELNEEDKDVFGNSWDFVTLSVPKNLVVAPNYKYLVKKYVCTDPECQSIQSFKGCCQTCRFNDANSEEKSFVKTIEFRVWNNE